MAIDADAAKALVLLENTVHVERGRLRFFAEAIGETDPIYRDVEAARAAGFADLPVPPTFYFSLGLEAPDPFGYLAQLGVDLRTILHGEQKFEYFETACAGDDLTITDRIVDVYSKRGGALEFLVKEMLVTRGDVRVAAATSVIVVQNGGGQQ